MLAVIGGQRPQPVRGQEFLLVEQLGETMDTDALEPVAATGGADKPFFEKVKDLFG